MEKSIAELAAMRARGELTADEFAAAKKILLAGSSALAQPEPPSSIVMPESIKQTFDQYSAKPSVTPTKSTKATSPKDMFMGLLVLGGIVWGIVSVWGGDSKPSQPRIRTDVVNANASPEEKRKGFHCLSSWDGSYAPLTKVVEENLRDPGSFQHDGTRITPVDQDGFHRVYMTYRAKNGFGGYNFEVADARVRNSDCAMISNSVRGN